MDEAESPTDIPGEDETAKETNLYEEGNTEEYPTLGNVVILGTKPTTDAIVHEITKKIDLKKVTVDVELGDQNNYAKVDFSNEEVKFKKDTNLEENNIELENYIERNFIEEGMEFKTDIDNIGATELLLVENMSNNSCIKVEFKDSLELTVGNDPDDNYGFKIAAVEGKFEMFEDDVKSQCMSSPSLKLVYSSEDENKEFGKSPNNSIVSIVDTKYGIQDQVGNAPEVNNFEDIDMLNEIDELISNTGVNQPVEHKGKATYDLIDDIVILDDEFDDDVIMIKEGNVFNNCNDVLVNESNNDINMNIHTKIVKNNIVCNKELVCNTGHVNAVSNKVSKVNIKKENITLNDDETIIIEDDDDVVIKTEINTIENKQDIFQTEILKSKRRKLQWQHENCKYKCIICSKRFLDYYNAENHRKFYHGHMTNRFIIRKLVKTKKQKIRPGYLKKLYTDIFKDLKSELLKVKTHEIVNAKVSEIEDTSVIETENLTDNNASVNTAEINKVQRNDKRQDAVILKENQIPINDEAKMIDLYKCLYCGLHYLLRRSLYKHAKTCTRRKTQDDPQKCFVCHLVCSKTLFFEHLKQHEVMKNIKFNIIDIDIADGYIETSADIGTRAPDTEQYLKINAARTSDIKVKKQHRKLRKLKPKSYKEDDDDDVAMDNMRSYFRCFKCAVVYESIKGVERHIAGGHKKSYSVICQICNLRVNSKISESHKSVHKDIDDFCINIVGPDGKVVERYIHRTVNGTSATTNSKICDESEVMIYESDSTNEDKNCREHFEDSFDDGESYDKIYKCKSCPVHFPTVATFLEHIFNRNHGNSHSCSSNEESRFCQYCGKIFYTKCIDEHEKIHHEDKTVGDTLLVIDKDPTKVIKAQSSKAKILKTLKLNYKAKNYRNRHKESVENTNKEDAGDKRRKQNHTGSKNDLKDNTMKITNFKCSKCSLCFNNKYSYAGHFRHCKCSKTFPCKICGGEFTEFGLKKHKKVHSNTKLPCDSNESNKTHKKTTANKGENNINLAGNEFANDLVSNTDKAEYIAINKELEVLEKQNEQISKAYTIYKCAQCSTHLHNLTSIYIHLRYAKHIEDIDGIKCQICKLKFSFHSIIDHANFHSKNKKINVETFASVDDIVKSLTEDNKAEKAKDDSNLLTGKLRTIRIARSRKSEDLSTDNDYQTIEEITKVFNDLEDEAIKILHEKRAENNVQDEFNFEIYKIMTDSMESNVENISVQKSIEASLESTLRQSDYPNLSFIDNVAIDTNRVIQNSNPPVYSKKEVEKNATNNSNPPVYNKNYTLMQPQVTGTKKPRKSILNYDKRMTSNEELTSLQACLKTSELVNLASNNEKYAYPRSAKPNSSKYVEEPQALPIDYSMKTNINILKKNLPKKQAKSRKQVAKKVNATKTCTKDSNSSPKIVNYNVNNYDNSNIVYFVENNTSMPINSEGFTSNNTRTFVTKQTRDNINVQRLSVISPNPTYSDTNKYIVNNGNTCNSTNTFKSNIYYTINEKNNKTSESFKNYKVPYNTDFQTANTIVTPQIDKYAKIINKELSITCSDKITRDKNDLNESQHFRSDLASTNIGRHNTLNVSRTKTNTYFTGLEKAVVSTKELNNVSTLVGHKDNNDSNKKLMSDVVPNVTVQVIHAKNCIDLTKDNEVNIVSSSNDVANLNVVDNSINNHALFDRLLKINDDSVKKLLEDLFKKNATKKLLE